jgi:hypothetical protein
MRSKADRHFNSCTGKLAFVDIDKSEELCGRVSSEATENLHRRKYDNFSCLSSGRYYHYSCKALYCKDLCCSGGTGSPRTSHIISIDDGLALAILIFITVVELKFFDNVGVKGPILCIKLGI